MAKLAIAPGLGPGGPRFESGHPDHFMDKDEISRYFECLGEIWRDVTAIEFAMRCAIAKKDGEEEKFPEPPYKKGKVYDSYPDSFGFYSFEMVVKKFNKRFPHIDIPLEIIYLRDAMAHGIMAEVGGSGIDQLIKFKEDKDNKKLVVEFSRSLELDRLIKIRLSLRGLRQVIFKEINSFPTTLPRAVG